jgi:dTDP-4-amino-4,6-dideoxygalactose transaminase
MRLSKSILDKQESDAISNLILNNGYLGMGEEVKLFENEIANYLNVPSQNVVCVNTGTSALHLAVESILNKGDEILVPSFTFLSSFQAISASGAVPIACDIDNDTLNINLEDAKCRLTSKTKAIMPVHYASNPANIESVYHFAKIHKLRIIEDAAHAFGCSINNNKIGSFGDIICFSFDGIKNITSGEGGAIVTKDKNVLDILKDARLLSIEKDSEKRYEGKRSWDFDVKRQGYRYHMSNIFAAIGRVQLKKLDNEFSPKRKALLKKYLTLLGNNTCLKLQLYHPNADIIPHIFPIRVLNSKRDSLRNELEKHNIPTGIHYKPNHLLTFFKTNYSLKITENVYEEILTLPLHPEITFDEVELICKIINNYTKS